MLEEYLEKYDVFVKANPRMTAEIEAIIRWSSYLIATRKSPVLGELLSSSANLLQLCNDIILRQANSELKLNLKSYATQLKAFLSVLQSLELLAEIYARDTYGNAGRWAIITIIQATKAVIKLILLLVFDEGISKSQAIVPLNRLHYTEIAKLQDRFGQDHENEAGDQDQVRSANKTKESKPLILKSSGRRMRSINESQSILGSSSETGATGQAKSFTDLQRRRLLLLLDRYKEHQPAVLTEKQLCGELLHITRPIAHLALMGAFGFKSWISYTTSLLMDVSSLYLVRHPLPIRPQQSSEHLTIPKQHQFNANERMELGKRASSLLLYLLRSPFFDQYTKERALEGLATTAESIPILGQFLTTFINYIPDWQQDYFRVWSE